MITPSADVFTPEIRGKYTEEWRTEFGVSDLTLMDARTREEADTEAFVAPLQRATGVWILGGHLNPFIDKYLGTRAEQEMKTVPERGGVLGGSSAGAMIMGSFLITWDSASVPPNASKKGVRLDQAHLKGFGELRNVTVYPHFFVRKAQWQMSEIVALHPELLGIGIDENTGIVVHQDQFEVFGTGRVGIFESKNPKKYLTLSRGQKYDLKNRTLIR